MTFSATIEADIFTDALGPVEALVNECKIRTESDGLSITAVDPANVGMVDLDIDGSVFASYASDGGVIGVNLDRLTDVVGFAESGEMVTLELDEETRKLHIDVGGLEYTLALIDPDSIREEPDIPDLDLPATFVFEARELDRAVTAADLVSDHISIRSIDDGMAFEAEGDTDDVSVTLEDDELLSARDQSDDVVSSMFSLDYLIDMNRPMSSDTEVSLLLGSEMPIKLRYSYADGDVEVVNMLAPRINSG